MDVWKWLAVPILLASFATAAFVVGFLAWYTATTIRHAHRLRTRRHLYVRVTAAVLRVRVSARFVTLYVRYEHAGVRIENRFSFHDTARAIAARERGFIELDIDPEYPRDVQIAGR